MWEQDGEIDANSQPQRGILPNCHIYLGNIPKISIFLNYSQLDFSGLQVH